MRPRGRVRKGEPKKSSSSESSAAHIIACNDMLVELLVRLPVKSLLKLKSVSKRWLCLIEDPDFIRRKNLKSGAGAASALFLDCTSRNSQRYYEVVPVDPSQGKAAFKHLRFEHSHDGMEIIQSCKGLMLCCSAGKDKYLVYNPSTKQYKTLPPFDSGKLVLGVSLAFDPSKSHSYKVVCVESCKYSYNGFFQIWMYSSESGHWRVSGGPFRARPFTAFWGAAYCNGAIHWVAWRTDASIYFDVNEEVVGEIPIPPPPSNDARMRPIPYFGESGGHLHFVDDYQDLTSLVHVYEMERDRSCWFVKFRVDRNGMSLFNPRHCFTRILCLVRGEKEEDSFLVMWSNGNVIRYNFIRQTHQHICRTNSPRFSVFQYIESLLPLCED